VAGFDSIDRDGVGREGIDRRTLIKGAAIAGAGAWTAPMIVDSLASPAAAGSLPPGSLGCSYAMVVFTIAGNATIYVAKVGESGQSCAGTGTTSSDATFSTSCNGHTFDTTTVTHQVSRDGTLVTPYTTSPCPGLFTVGNNAIEAAGNVTILFSVGHAGSCPGKFCIDCPSSPGPGSTVHFPGCG